MSHTLWGAIDMLAWRTIPSLSGRIAVEADVKEGLAVFFQQGTGVIMEPVALELPRPAILRAEGSSVAEEPVVVIQVERAADQVLVGYRGLHGGNGIATMPEIELLDEADARFGVSRDPGGAA